MNNRPTPIPIKYVSTECSLSESGRQFVSLMQEMELLREELEKAALDRALELPLLRTSMDVADVDYAAVIKERLRRIIAERNGDITENKL